MVEPGRSAVVHYVARPVEGADAGEVVVTTDVDLALGSGVYHGHRNYDPLAIEVGGERVLPGVDGGLRETNRREERTVLLDATESGTGASARRLSTVTVIAPLRRDPGGHVLYGPERATPGMDETNRSGRSTPRRHGPQAVGGAPGR